MDVKQKGDLLVRGHISSYEYLFLYIVSIHRNSNQNRLITEC